MERDVDEKTRRKEKDYQNSNSTDTIQMKLDQFIQYLLSFAIIQQILYMYNQMKESNENVKRTFDTVEDAFRVAYTHLLDLYNRYQQTNVNKQPRHILETVLDYGIGVVVILMQLNLTLIIAIVTIIFSAIVSGKEAVDYACKSTTNAQATARQMVTDFSDKVQQISRASMEKAEEKANRILDEADRVAHMTMGVSDESDDIEKTPWNRFQDLTRRILENSKNRVEEFYWTRFDPKSIVECLSYSISLADMVRENKAWVFNKAGELRTSLDELKTSLEMEGRRLRKNPEEILMRYLQGTSSILLERLRTLEEATGKVLSEQATSKLVTLISYIDKLNEKLTEADDVHELKDEVLKEAHDRLVDLVQWLTDHMGDNEDNSAKNMASTSSEEAN